MMTESIGVQDQTGSLFKHCEGYQHVYVSIKTGSPLIQWVERCVKCGFIDSLALQRAAENAIKLSLEKRAQHAALAAESEPFAFVQGGDAADLSIEDILVQAFSAVQVATAAREEIGPAEFHKRARAIYAGTLAELQRMIRIAVRNEEAVS